MVERDVGKRTGGGGRGEDDVEGWEGGNDGGDDTRSVTVRREPVRPTQSVRVGMRSGLSL